MKIRMKRLLSFLLALCLCLTMVPVITPTTSGATISETEFANKIAQLKTVYRDLEYWNYYNSCGVEGTGPIKCYCSKSCPADCKCECGKFFYNDVKYGGQCFGFANKMAFLIFGSIPDKGTYASHEWTYSKSVSNYYAGDYVRIRNDAHSIFITKVSGNTVTYVDCNNYGPCQVKWERTMSVSDLKNVTTYVYHLPGNTLTGTGTGSAPDPNPPASRTADSRYNGFVPFQAYTVSTGNVAVYNENGVKFDNRSIYPTDLCTINAIYTDGWCQVKYPSSVEPSGYFTAYVKTTEFIPGGTPSSWTCNAKVTAYRRSSGSDTIGSVFVNDNCLKLGTANGRTQVIYPTSGSHKMGWIVPGSNPTPDPTPSPGTATGYTLPCHSYAISTGKITVYDSGRNPYAKRYISGDSDLCIIEEIYSDGWCKVKYPSTAESSGYFTAYCPLSEFIPNANPVTWTATNKYTAYRRSSGAETIGSVSTGDKCVKVSEQNGRIQVMYPVSGTNYYKMGWLDASTSHNPEGVFDEATGGLRRLHVRGWAFDRDNLGASLEIHVYVGGTHIGTLTANSERSDVNNVYAGVGIYHGFDGYIDIPANKTGSQKVEVFALNVGGGNNVSLGSKTVTISNDTTGPTISNVSVSNITANGYTVTCTVTDTNGVDRVQFPTWTVYNEQDDIFSNWSTNPAASGTKNGNTYTYQVHTSAHNYEGGRYLTHIYAYDKYGNQSKYTLSEVVVPIQVAELFLNTYSLSFETLNTTQTLTATVTPSNATDKTITWSSSNTAVATVSNGTVKAVGYGTAVITATASNGLSISCNVSVSEPTLSGISVATKPTKTSYVVGDTLNTAGLTLTATYSNGTTKTITSGFTCSPTKLNTAGTQTITVTYGGKSATFTVTVKEIPSGAMSVSRVSGKPGETVTVAIKLDSNPGIIAARLKVAYDSDVLTLTEAKDGGILGEYLFGGDLKDNPYVLTWENGLAQSDYTATGNLVYLTFRIAQDAPEGEVPITVTYEPDEIYNKDLTNVTFTVTQGAVTVEKAAEVDPNGPQIVVGSKTVTRGGTVTLDVEIVNNPGFSVLNVAFIYDKTYLTLTKVENLVQSMTMTQDSTVLWDSLQDYTADGALCRLTFEIAQSAPEGEYEIQLLFIDASNSDFEELEMTGVSGILEVCDILYGDVNGDGKISAVDLAMLRKYIASMDPITGECSIIVGAGADCNGDGKISAVDLAMLRKYLASVDPFTGESTVIMGPK